MPIEFERVDAFDACGRTRDRRAEQEAADRRAHDEGLAARCLKLEMNPYRSKEPIIAVDILSEGAKTRDLGSPLLHRRFFHTVAVSENSEIFRLCDVFFPSINQGSLMEAIVRPKHGKPLTRAYRSQHRDHVRRVGAAIKQLRRLEIAEVLFVVRHPRPIANGYAIDLHSHLVIEVKLGRLDDLIVFLATRFSTDERGVSDVAHPTRLVRYLLQPRHWRLGADIEEALPRMCSKTRRMCFPRPSIFHAAAVKPASTTGRSHCFGKRQPPCGGTNASGPCGASGATLSRRERS